jgi:hypothetical protein
MTAAPNDISVRPVGDELMGLSARINAAHAEARTAAQSALTHAREAGELLIEAKARLPHGEWLPWLGANCPDIAERTAQTYMRIAREWNRLNPSRGTDLPLREARRLLADPKPLPLAAGGTDEDVVMPPEDDTPPSTPPEAYTRMTQVLLNGSEHTAFQADADALKPAFGISAKSEVVSAAVRFAREVLTSPIRHVPTIQLAAADLMPDAEAEALEGGWLDERHYDRVIRDTTVVRKPDGRPVVIYVKDALPRAQCETVLDVFRNADLHSENRGTASGGPRLRRVKQDGTVSRTREGQSVPSGVVGFYDRYPRIPYCRMTRFNLDHHGEFERARPFVVALSEKFRELAPNRWAAQRAFIDRVSPDFLIRDSVFTTLTVNRSWRTAAHRDEGDLRDGFGVISVAEAGHFDGGELIFPRYRTAVDLRTGGLLLCDVHELHGNAPLIGEEFLRLAIVAYAREGMAMCGSAEEELARARAHQ